MVVTRTRENKQMEEELSTIKSKLEDLDQKFLASIFSIHPWTTATSLSLLQKLGSRRLNNFRETNMDFPCFNGDDSNGWIYREEQYFSFHNTLDVNKVPLASFRLEHETLQ